MEITENKFKDPSPEIKVQETPVATYDPTKRYRWPKNAQFSFTGQEFGIVLNSLRQVLTTPEAQAILLAERASSLVENALAKAVESGLAYEEPENKK